MFFAINPKKSVISDLNSELIDVYKCVRDEPKEIARLLDIHQYKHCNEHYYSTRALVPNDLLDRSARFIYLNRTCWNGLYRVNKKGEFNVPIGTKSTVKLPSDRWQDVSELLKTADIISGDFEKSINLAKNGDLVFADPPYTVKHNYNGFIKYNEAIFTWEDQIRLRDALLAASRRGATVVLTNAAHESIRELYKNDFSISTLNRASVLAGSSAARGNFEEFLITANYE